MIDGRKNRKDFTSIVSETFKDFAENTSIHGLRYAVRRDIVIYEKIFWVFVVLTGLGGAGYMTVLFWNRYTSNPTRTSILTDFAPNTAVPFPAVTICNINRIMADRLEEFMGKLAMREEDVEIVRRAFPQLLAFVAIDRKVYNMSELMVLHKVLVTNNYNDIGVVMKKISQSCNEMIRKCEWEFETVPCERLFQETLTTDGNCCSFNYLREYINVFRFSERRRPVYTPFNGFNAGLKLLLDPDIQAVQYSTLHSSGLKVMVHSAWDYPGSGSIYKIVSAGRQSYLQVSASKIVCSSDFEKLSIQQRQCAYYDDVKLRYFKFYSDTNCLTECEAKYLYAKCECVPFYYPFSTKRICNLTSIPCLHDAIGTTLVNITKACNCPSQCEDVFYNVLSSTASLGREEAAPTSDFFEDQNVTDSSIALYVYYQGQTQTILYKDIITSTIYLLSSFGGVYSLFLGCSFISVVEIIYYFTFRLLVNMKLIGRIDKTDARARREDARPVEKLWTHDGVFLN
ncbi:sodium channel protein Nach-like [Tribolium madens]|uniref:sodium channel protein Nach-like n=1 Tax=Tribolium madens TaxID=41895 RepID=UPI001CF75D0A|nr:sodium channel protein Nach-like [Tribolium madens]